eukprot:c15092_g1_i2.p1 GENE.c15092_g1_i2~~c15092_g1_i2.p1  ORF type:complete len:280 (+),score=47.17 c15092_g1_i2:116-841(+)
MCKLPTAQETTATTQQELLRANLPVEHDVTTIPIPKDGDEDAWTMTCDHCGAKADGLANLLRHKASCQPSIQANVEYLRSFQMPKPLAERDPHRIIEQAHHFVNKSTKSDSMIPSNPPLALPTPSMTIRVKLSSAIAAKARRFVQAPSALRPVAAAGANALQLAQSPPGTIIGNTPSPATACTKDQQGPLWGEDYHELSGDILIERKVAVILPMDGMDDDEEQSTTVPKSPLLPRRAAIRI